MAWAAGKTAIHSRTCILMGRTIPALLGNLASFLEENFAGRRVFLIYGAMRDKAVDEVTGLLFPLAIEVIFTQPNNPRAVSASQLAQMAGHHASHFSVIGNAEAALDAAFAQARPDDAIFVTGSLYLVGQLRHAWKEHGNDRSHRAGKGRRIRACCEVEPATWPAFCFWPRMNFADHDE